jgi:hypothetical protein
VARSMRILADVRPLRESAPFRRLWIGQTLSGVGSAMTMFAVTLQRGAPSRRGCSRRTSFPRAWH